MNRLRGTRSVRRRGLTLFESAVAGVLLTACMATLLYIISTLVAARRSSDSRQWALAQANNLLETVSCWNWDEITEEKLNQLRLPEQADQILRRHRLQFDMETNRSEKRIRVTIRWAAAKGTPEAPVRLVCWRYRDGGTP